MNEEPAFPGSPEDEWTLPAQLWDLPESAGRLRGALWTATEKVQRRRRRVRRLGQGAACALLYLLGVASARWWQAAPSPAAPVEAAVVSAVDSDAPALLARDLGAVQQSATPEELERGARLGGLRNRPERWREAGDLYLQQRSDVDAALRCYRNLLDLLPEEQRGQPEGRDSWLLRALKRDLTQRSGP